MTVDTNDFHRDIAKIDRDARRELFEFLGLTGLSDISAPTVEDTIGASLAFKQMAESAPRN